MCKKLNAVLLCLLIAIVILIIPTPRRESEVVEEQITEDTQRIELTTRLREFLDNKESPLAPDTEFLLELEHWKLLVAISAIESQYCKHQLGYNCWGIGGDSAYRYYSSFRAAAQDANDLIEHWQTEHKKWLTVEEMNCSYVVPCSENWVRVVNLNLGILNGFEK